MDPIAPINGASPNDQPRGFAALSTEIRLLLGLLFTGLGWAAAHFGFEMLSPKTSMSISVGMVVGLVLALVPFFIARRRGLPKLAAHSLIAGGVLGAIGGAILALPATIVLAIVAARMSPPSPEPRRLEESARESQ